jgi:hypothetical protein
MNLTRQLRSANWQVIARALPRSSALVEFVRFDPYNFQAVPARGDARWEAACYGAFVFHAGQQTTVTKICLADAATIDRFVSDFLLSITLEAQPEERAVHDGIRTFRLDPPHCREKPGEACAVRSLTPLPALEGCTHLFLAPDGELTRLPFEVLPLEETKSIFLLDHYQIRYLSSGRDILRFKMSTPETRSAPFVLTNPDFDLARSASQANIATQVPAIHSLPFPP